MCDLCTSLSDELLHLTIERELVLAESDAGLSTKTAVRPLTSNEKRARVRFGDIDDMERTAESDAATLLIPLRAEVNDALLDELFTSDAVRPQELADKLTTLMQVQPDRVQRAQYDVSVSMSRLLRDVYRKSAEMVIDEARRQGSDVDKLPDERLKFADTPTSIFDTLSAGVSAYFWQRVTTVLMRELLSPATLMKPVVQRADVETIVDGIDPAGALDNASQAVHAARGAGRYDQAAEFEPEEIWASELMDGRTCRPCELVDGKEYATLAQARVEYEAGGYGACKGGARCRGTLVMIYGDPPEKPIEPPAPAIAPAPAAPKKPRAARKPKAADTLPSPEIPDGPTAKPTRPVDPDGRQRYISLKELPKKTSNVVKPRTLDEEVIKHLPAAKRTAAKKLARAAGLLDEAKLVNPLHKKADVGGFGYTSNCSNCVTAYEMRRRGYDVQAAKITQKGRIDREFVDEWWKSEEGWTPSTEFVEGGKRGMDAWAADYPDGARGFIMVQWKAGGGHVFSWEKVDGKLMYIEPQTPNDPDGQRHFARVRNDMTRAVRVDDLIPTDRVAAAVETAGRKS
ncbi:capsid maturation protease [Arthrobacter phage Grekaycon]|uniref:Capsid maturation protease n=3 Tax=Marthavirus martha TaxID=1980950 RepID=A0A514A5E1_9CAUD|nr:head maturation protease [Arthrobacter phage Martha]ALY09657.1 capsid maturation protease [Arthrobacter phage Martha]ALY10461.1 capsid maturation protease [Arthrobacter phage TaeYoung]QDH48494.1 capsid maturation protease [Arthrobacter phage Grekaycon]